MITIDIFKSDDTNNIIELVLGLQNDGSRPMVSVKEQPDLLNIQEEYIDKGGCFWVAKINGSLIGSIGLMPYTDGIWILKKFFVKEQYQGKPYHIGQKLYKTLLSFAKEKDVKTILLDTPYNTTRAHRFYEKAGFSLISEDKLPVQYSHPYKDCDFFILHL